MVSLSLRQSSLKMKNIYLIPDINGIVREKFLTVAISDQVRKTKLNSYIPANGNKHKVYSGKAEEYALSGRGRKR